MYSVTFLCLSMLRTVNYLDEKSQDLSYKDLTETWQQFLRTGTAYFRVRAPRRTFLYQLTSWLLLTGRFCSLWLLPVRPPMTCMTSIQRDIFLERIFCRISDRTGIFKRLWSPGIDSKEWIPAAYVAWRAYSSSVPSPHRLFKNSSSGYFVSIGLTASIRIFQNWKLSYSF